MNEVIAFGGLYKGKDFRNYSYSSGPFIKLNATKDSITIRGVFRKIELKKSEIKSITAIERVLKKTETTKIIKGVQIHHKKDGEKPMIIFTPFLNGKLLDKLKSLGYK